MKTLLIFILVLWSSLPIIAQTEMIFHSREELNSHRFANTNLSNETDGFLLDHLEEWTSGQIDTFLVEIQKDTTSMYGVLNLLNIVEAADVTNSFKRDSLLFPVMRHYWSLYEGKKVEVPLFIVDMKMNRLNTTKRSMIDMWTGTEGYPALTNADMTEHSIHYFAFFRDTLHNDDISVYWDENTFVSNKNRSVSSVNLTIGTQTVALPMGARVELSDYLSAVGVGSIAVEVTFSDSTTITQFCDVDFDISPKTRSGIATPRFGDHSAHLTVNGYDTELHFTILYGCEDGVLNKPYLLIGGWGAYTDNPTIDYIGGYPSDEQDLYYKFNTDGFVDDLRQVGYDVVIARFFPPNDDAVINALLLKELIKWVNGIKTMNNSYEENVIQGYSAGALAVRLALEWMENDHLYNNGPHPHTKLYVSVEGEQQGANIPLAAQHCVDYLAHFQLQHIVSFEASNMLTAYGLYYILNAPLSQNLLHYDYHMTGTFDNPGQGHHPRRQGMLNLINSLNHHKSTEVGLPGYPSFNRNIVVSNGMNESDINGHISNHHPFPNLEGYIPFKQLNSLRKWHTAFNIAGGNTVYKYEYRFTPWSNWSMQREARTNAQCLVLDNAPGGSMWIDENPMIKTMEMMRKMISENPEIYNPHTLFAFTPTVSTLDIRNFRPDTTGYRMNYSLKQNKLMFQHLNHVDSNIHSEFWGYPHLAYPYSHYWEATPFDAVFAWNKNTEHNLHNEAYKDNPNDGAQQWIRLPSPYFAGTVKNFLMDEADYYNAFIQNKRYGWNARDNYVYKASVVVPNIISVGQEVTQRTNFRPAEFLSNSDMYLQAGEEIVFYPGTEINAGATFHATIAPYHCGFAGMTTGGNNANGQAVSERISVSTEETSAEVEEKIPYVIYPNPSNGEVNIRNLHPEKVGYEYIIYDLSGNELTRGESQETITTFRVATGMYIVKLNNHEKSYSYKVIVR